MSNSSPVDFYYLMKRRRITFDQWCSSVGITTQESYAAKKNEVESLGEFFFSPELDQLSLKLPKETDIKTHTTPEPEPLAETTLEEPVLNETEEPAVTKKSRRTIPSEP